MGEEQKPKKKQAKGHTFRFASEEEEKKVMQMCEFWDLPLNRVVRKGLNLLFDKRFIPEIKLMQNENE